MEIMELHGNKLPAYILIQDKPGRAKAEEFYESYTDTDEIEKAIKLVNDMAKAVISEYPQSIFGFALISS